MISSIKWRAENRYRSCSFNEERLRPIEWRSSMPLDHLFENGVQRRRISLWALTSGQGSEEKKKSKSRISRCVVLCWVGWLVGRREIGRQSSVGSADDRERPTIRGEEICWQCFVQREMNEVEKGTTVLFACVFPSSFLLEAITEYQESSLFFAFSSIERERGVCSFSKGNDQLIDSQWHQLWLESCCFNEICHRFLLVEQNKQRIILKRMVSWRGKRTFVEPMLVSVHLPKSFLFPEKNDASRSGQVMPRWIRSLFFTGQSEKINRKCERWTTHWWWETFNDLCLLPLEIQSLDLIRSLSLSLSGPKNDSN